MYISQGSVMMHVLCGGYNNHIIENWLRCVPVKKILQIS